MREVIAYEGKPYEGRGLFHGWSTSYIEGDEGLGSYCVAIVELPSGKVETVPADYVKFLTPPQSEVATLRDQFAGQVISATLASEGRRFYQDQDTTWAYEIADAMLKAREAKP